MSPTRRELLLAAVGVTSASAEELKKYSVTGTMRYVDGQTATVEGKLEEKKMDLINSLSAQYVEGRLVFQNGKDKVEYPVKGFNPDKEGFSLRWQPTLDDIGINFDLKLIGNHKYQGIIRKDNSVSEYILHDAKQGIIIGDLELAIIEK